MFINITDVLIYLAIFISVCLGIIALVFLVKLLVGLSKAISKVNKILEDSTDSIEITVRQLPLLVASIDRTVISANETLNGVNDTFFDKKAKNDMVTTVISIVESVANLVANFYSKKKD